jgi:two-component system OmpR family sensor kinase/two-component system sensor histidine kinase QseC
LLRRAGDAAEREAAGTALGTGIERASRLVEQLLALARSEPGAPATMEPVDLEDVARAAVADTVAFASGRGVTLELDAAAPVRASGDGVAFGLLVRNLVDNAARYSPKGSLVVVRVTHDEGRPILLVDDAGPGIPAAERERVFDRFYRRADPGETGSGLGLAIVRSIATAHGASVELADSPLGGLRVVVRFAPAPAEPVAAA